MSSIMAMMGLNVLRDANSVGHLSQILLTLSCSDAFRAESRSQGLEKAHRSNSKTDQPSWVRGQNRVSSLDETRIGWPTRWKAP